MKVILKRIVLGSVAALLIGGPSLADNQCASAEQRQTVQDYLAENPSSMPVQVSREIKMPEAIVASAYPEDRVSSASGEAFSNIWTAMTKLDEVTVLITKGPEVFEIKSGIGAGARSDTNPFFNLDHDNAFSGHLRPDLYASIYVVAIPRDEGKVGRGIFFYRPDGQSAFGILVSGNGPTPAQEQVAKFDDIMAMIKELPSVCAGS